MNDAIDGHLPLGVCYKSVTGQLIINVLMSINQKQMISKETDFDDFFNISSSKQRSSTSLGNSSG